MKDETKRVLDRFVKKAHELESRKFVDYLKTKGPIGINAQKQADDSWTIEAVGPDDEATHAFMPTVRQFIRDEPISFRSLLKLCDDPDLSDKWKQGFIRIREEVNRYLDSYPDFPFAPGEKPMTRRGLLNVFLDGDIFHVKDEQKRDTFERWSTQEFYFLLLINEFNQILIVLFRAISYIAHLTQQELQSDVI